METNIYTSIKKAVGTFVICTLFIMSVVATGYWVILLINKPAIAAISAAPTCASDIALVGCEHSNSTLNRQLDIVQLENERLAQKLDTCEEILMLRNMPRIKR